MVPALESALDEIDRSGAGKCARVDDDHSDDPAIGDQRRAGCAYFDIDAFTDDRSDRLDTVHNARPHWHEPVSLQTDEADFRPSLRLAGGHYIATPSEFRRRPYPKDRQVSLAGLQSCCKKFSLVLGALILEERNDRSAVDGFGATAAHHMIGRGDVEKTASLTDDETKAVVGGAVRPLRGDPDDVAPQLER